MINITDKSHCCGCNACVQSCPVSCIKREEDEEGFLYPKANAETCINCGLCEKVCPCLNITPKANTVNIYSAINTNEEIRTISSSGGVFTAISELTLKNDGIVYGAMFNKDWQVIHGRVDNIKDLSRIRGSKYVQSDINHTFVEVKEDLHTGRKVLFSGTPCQIKGLHLFLQKDYKNLLTVEVVCHGVPSPKVWQTFLEEINPRGNRISSVNFRDKSRGWSSYSVEIMAEGQKLYSDYARNCLFINGFIQNLTIRPSCFKCPAKSGASMADITLADFWGINADYPEASDEKGVNAVISYTEKGNQAIQNADIKLYPGHFENFIAYNKSYTDNPTFTPYRQLFWNLFSTQGISAIAEIKRRSKIPLIKRVINKIKSTFLK